MGKTKPKTRALTADTSKWSVESKRSYALIPHYKDVHFQCRNCGGESVYLAIDQKCDFEERKLHIHTQRILCPLCFKGKRALERKIWDYQQQWKTNKKELMVNLKFINSWIFLLERLPKYGARKNPAQVSMLRKIKRNIEAISA